jgi:hypothetical protein
MYLYNTASYGITYSKSQASTPLLFEAAKHPLDDGTNSLQVFVDSDYAGDITRKSTYGYVFMLNGGPVAWSSTLGKTVALSTCEAEVSAAVVACREAIHFKGMLVEMGLFDAKQPLQIAEDNSACIAQAQVNGQLVVDKDVNFVYCPTKSQLADHFTKPQDEATFMKMRDAMLRCQ